MLAPVINTPINVKVNRIKLSNGWCRLAVVVSTWWSLWWTRWIIQRGLILCSNQWGRYAPIRSRNKIPKKTLIQIGSIGSQFNKPNLFEATISEIFNHKKANKNFISPRYHHCGACALHQFDVRLRPGLNSQDPTQLWERSSEN